MNQQEYLQTLREWTDYAISRLTGIVTSIAAIFAIMAVTCCGLTVVLVAVLMEWIK